MKDFFNNNEWQSWTGDNKCPNCNSNNIEVNTQVVLATYPVKSLLRCRDCGHYFGSVFSTENTNKDALDDMWKHDQSILNIPKVGEGELFPIQTPPNTPPATDKTTMYGWICPKCGSVMSPYTAQWQSCVVNAIITSNTRATLSKTETVGTNEEISAVGKDTDVPTKVEL